MTAKKGAPAKWIPILILCSGSFLGSENGSVRESLECVDSRYLYRFSMSLQTLPILHVPNDSV